MLAHRHWENPETTGFGRQPARASFRQTNMLDLNGTWRFKRYPHPDSVDQSWFDTNLDDSQWQTIEVPSLWTRQTTPGPDLPIYTNVRMPFTSEPPIAPKLNPTGIYRRTFELPEIWAEDFDERALSGSELIAFSFL